jgi:hypothetical protein
MRFRGGVWTLSCPSIELSPAQKPFAYFTFIFAAPPRPGNRRKPISAAEIEERLWTATSG